MAALRSLDLFTGTGGIAYALRGGIARPVAYCEIDPGARSILEANMRRGHLHRAPIEEDVQKIDHAQYKGKVDLIAGGFPCVGMSAMGRREGLDNPASALFYDVVKLVEAIQPPLVFLENVGNIVSIALDEIVAELGGRLGYELRWVTLASYVVGSPQSRERWFLLAVRPGYNRKPIRLSKVEPFGWKEPPPPRMAPRPIPPDHKTRMGALGNGVVPDVVRLAFLFLASGGSVRRLEDTPSSLRIDAMDLPGIGAVSIGKDKRLRKNGVFGTDREARSFPTPFGVEKPDLRLRLTPAGSRPGPVHPNVRTPLVKGELPLRTWGTPRHGNTGACATLTERCARDLPSQMKFEKGTPVSARRGIPNIAFVEYLMGVPPGFSSP